MIKVSELYIYPVKSLAGLKVESAQLSRFGLNNDRRWMVVDENGRFISQREVAKMATIKTIIDQDQLCLSHRGQSIAIPHIDEENNKIEVSVWKDSLSATHVCKKVDQWLSKVLDLSCRLVYMDDSSKRQIDENFAQKGQYVSFADGFPLLLISQASMDDLNNRLHTPIDVNRFRPNIVVTGTQAFAEDHWQELSINDVELLAVKKCSRCIMPSINQETGDKDQLKMLSVLNSYRKENNKVMFGQNLIYKDVGQALGQTISCGDEVKLN